MTAPTLDLVKQYLRYELIDQTQHATLSVALKAGVAWVEKHTGVAIQRREFRQRLHRATGSVPLIYRPVSGDAALAYHDASGAAQSATLRVFGDDRAVIATAPGGWPAVNAGYPATITYIAGYADPDELPETLLHGVLLYAGMFDQLRGGEDMAAGFRALEMVLDGDRVMGL